MPAQYSKFFIGASCKEYAHPWTNSCVSTTAGLGLHCLQECLRIYSTLYIFTLLMRGKVPSKQDVKQTVLAILQSTAFLSWSGFAYSMFICSLRRILGHFNVLTVSFIPSFLSSLSAIVIERPSRRTLLCLYVSNIATETLFKMGVWRGYFSAVPHGETYIFAASIAVLLYFFRTQKNNKDSVYKIIRFIIGPYEETEYLNKSKTCLESTKSTSDNDPTRLENNGKKQIKRNHFSAIWKTFEAYKKIIKYLKDQSKHASCPHPYSCAHYILTGTVKQFSLGICAQLGIKLIFQIRRILQNPKSLKSKIFDKENLNLAIYIGGFAGLYRLVSCLLRRSFGKDSEKYSIPAGLIASTTFVMYPDNTIALYFMWKALQMIWNNAEEKGKVPEVKWFVIALYCFSTAVLFHAAIIEPQNLRPSYWKFLYNLSGGRIATMSRTPLDKFGLDSSRMLQDVLRKTHTTDQISYSF